MAVESQKKFKGMGKVGMSQKLLVIKIKFLYLNKITNLKHKLDLRAGQTSLIIFVYKI